MAEAREVRVKLTADVSEYIAAMNEAKHASKGLWRNRVIVLAFTGGAFFGSFGTYIALILATL